MTTGAASGAGVRFAHLPVEIFEGETLACGLRTSFFGLAATVAHLLFEVLDGEPPIALLACGLGTAFFGLATAFGHLATVG